MGGSQSWWSCGAATAATLGVLLIRKFKFLLLGLTKLSTFASMFGFIAVYSSIHGWPLAVGLAGSIYIHEMGTSRCCDGSVFRPVRRCSFPASVP